MDPADVKDLETANEALEEVAIASFQLGFSAATAGDPGPSDPRKHAEWEASVAQGKSQMASALQQLVQADITRSEQQARDSYRTLALLIKETSDTGGALVTLMNTVPATADAAARAQLLNAYAALLQSLANLTPLATWTTPRSTG